MSPTATPGVLPAPVTPAAATPPAGAVWAPQPERVRLVLNGTEHPMVSGPGGWWLPPAGTTVGHGDRYGFRLDDEDTVLPDPRSRRQPDGVHQASQGYDPSRYAWGDQAWTGRQLVGGIVWSLFG